MGLMAAIKHFSGGLFGQRSIMDVSSMRRLKELDEENLRLKMMYSKSKMDTE